LESITFKTSQGTEIEVRNINTIATLDYMQAAVVVLDAIETAVEEGTEPSPNVISSGFIACDGGLIAVFPPEEEEDGEDSEEDVEETNDETTTDEDAPTVEELLEDEDKDEVIGNELTNKEWKFIKDVAGRCMVDDGEAIRLALDVILASREEEAKEYLISVLGDIFTHND